MPLQLAQLNIGRLLHPVDDPRIKEFMDGLDHINALAEQWLDSCGDCRPKRGNATGVHHPWSDDPFMLVNMSVWEGPEV